MSSSHKTRVKPRTLSKLCLGLICLAALVVAGCGSSGGSSSGGSSGTSASNSKKPILVGAAVALTGDEAPFDEPPMQAFQQAADEVNANGGINGRKLKVVVR